MRMDTRVGPRTRVEVVTEGILTRMLQTDPTLDGVGALLFDEFHERHLDADLLREALATLSPLDRELLLAREVEGEADRDIAPRFDMTVTGVRVRIHRARRKLQARFEKRNV